MNGAEPAARPRTIPVLLVTGFLGSGKTTFLRQLMRRQAGRRFVYLVNDFSALDVDAQLLGEGGGDILSIPGGSIFCRCLVTEFMGALQRIADTLDTPATPVEGVVVEASGMADPRAAGDLLRETGLEERFRLAGVVALVDPASFHKLLHTLPAVRAQIDTADLALVNKADLHDEAALARTEAALRALRPDLLIRRCTRAEVAVEPFTGECRALRITGELAACRNPDYLAATARFRLGQVCDPDAVLACLADAAPILLRAKGFVPVANGLAQVEWTLGGAHQAPASPKTRFGALSMIARGDAQRQLDILVRTLENL